MVLRIRIPVGVAALLLPSVAFSLAGCSAPSLAPPNPSTQSFAERAPAKTVYTMLYAFKGNPDGAQPYGGVTVDSSGNVFGTTFAGGSSTQPSGGAGTVFELAKTASGYSESVIHDFGADGYNPAAAPTEDQSADLYATAESGPKGSASGTIVELTPSAGTYSETALYAFGASTGSLPESPVYDSTTGSAIPNRYTTALYVSATQGGSAGFGSISILTPGLVFSNVYDFLGQAKGDGASPIGPLAVDPEDPGLGIYGATSGGGTSGLGTIFKFEPVTDEETPLYSFRGGTSDGQMPTGGVDVDSEGNIYGTTQKGGANGLGVIFKLTKSASGSFTESVLHSFAGGKDGATPYASPILSFKGNMLYGTTHAGGTGSGGTIYQISTTGTRYKVLHDFTTSTGASPGYGSLFVNGTTLYGTAQAGGPSGDGVVYSLEI